LIDDEDTNVQPAVQRAMTARAPSGSFRGAGQAAGGRRPAARPPVPEASGEDEDWDEDSVDQQPPVAAEKTVIRPIPTRPPKR
jgi:hypothetical protein